MKQIQTSILISAPVDNVWKVLTDFENYHNWNPFIKSVLGKTEVGNKISVLIEAPNVRPMTMRPTVLKYEINKEFRWKGKLIIPGVFDGEHYFILEGQNNGKTNFIHGEKFSGILVRLMGGILRNTEEGFKLMNAALKKEAEKA